MKFDKEKTKVFIRTVSLLFGLSLATAAFAVSSTQVERTVGAPEGATIEITNIAGSISVTGWDRPQVRVTGTLGPEVETLLADAQATRVLVAAIIPRFHSGEIEAQLRIFVPRASHIRVESVSASVAIDGVEGNLHLETVNGLIDVEGSPKTIHAKTVGGPVDIEGKPGPVVVETISGRVEIEAEVDDVQVTSVSGAVRLQGGVRGKVRATSIGGDLVAQIDEISEGIFESVTGSVRVGGTLAAAGSLEAGSRQGEVELQLPSSTSALFDVRTERGRIYNDFGPDPLRERRSSVLEFSQSGGDGSVIALSYGGDVSLLLAP